MFLFRTVILSVLICFINCSKPHLLKWSKLTTIRENSSIPLTCVSDSGTEPFKFEWFKNNEKITKQSFPKISITAIDSYSVLNLKNIKIFDAGEYSCHVENSDGSDSTTTILQVQGL